MNNQLLPQHTTHIIYVWESCLAGWGKKKFPIEMKWTAFQVQTGGRVHPVSVAIAAEENTVGSTTIRGENGPVLAGGR